MEQTQLTQVVEEPSQLPQIEEDYGDAWAILEARSPDVSTFLLTENEITIGRADSSTIRIPDRKISSIHCKIMRAVKETQGNNIYIQDLRFLFHNLHVFIRSLSSVQMEPLSITSSLEKGNSIYYKMAVLFLCQIPW